MYVCTRLISSILGIIDLAVFKAAGGRGLGKRTPRIAKPLPSACTRDGGVESCTRMPAQALMSRPPKARMRCKAVGPSP